MIEVKSLIKIFADRDNAGVRAVNDISFTVDEGRFYTLLGPSGCGKTTTLRCIAGLEKANDGEIVVAGQKVFSAANGTFVPAYRRSIGMVFQSYAIWPHMTVFENVAFPLRVGKERLSNSDIKKKVEAALAQVELGGYEERMATQLSGGQQQRLALARALVRQPQVLLLDEPLSNLDAKLRERMRVELRELQRRLRITTLYVTHDQIEALSMSNVIAVMSAGVIIQDDTGDVCCGLLPGLTQGTKVIVMVRPESVVLHQKKPPENENIIEGKVGAAMFLGEYVDCTVDIGKNVLQTHQHYTLQLRRGDPVWVELPAGECMALPAES
ncbi:MAG: ABC transporter ATP-binding protein [Deltaproteobacteria bacterium]|nr:ABC transporter ATP-binding protein [Deltaproteobacteria bacterium]